MGESPGGRRERKKHQTAVALHEAALRLFAQYGFAETTVEDIADEVDVSARTFFRYFSSKESVVYADEAERRDIWIAALRARSYDESVLDSICEASLVLAADYKREKDFLRWELAARNSSVLAAALQANSRWESAIALEVAERLGMTNRYDLTARTLAAASMGAWRAAQVEWYYAKGKSPLAGHIRRSYAVLTHLGALRPATSEVQVLDVREAREPVPTVRKKQ
ncbi:MAG: TetR family transcriptional regulator [Actinomycetota bacterium]|nr:TetR family transcriptional regulator [Actinomycetota bacterium]